MSTSKKRKHPPEDDAGGGAAPAVSGALFNQMMATITAIFATVPEQMAALDLTDANSPHTHCKCGARLPECHGPEGTNLPPHQPCYGDPRVLATKAPASMDERNFLKRFMEWLRLQPGALQALGFNSEALAKKAMGAWSRCRLLLVTWHCGFWGQHEKPKQDTLKNRQRVKETYTASSYVSMSGGTKSHAMREAINFLIALIPLCQPGCFALDASLLVGDGDALAKLHLGCSALLVACFPASLLAWVARFRSPKQKQGTPSQRPQPPVSRTELFLRMYYAHSLAAGVQGLPFEAGIEQRGLLWWFTIMLQHPEHFNFSPDNWLRFMRCLCRDGIWLPPLAECDFSSVRAFIVQMFLFNRSFERTWMQQLYPRWAQLAPRDDAPTAESLSAARQARANKAKAAGESDAEADEDDEQNNAEDDGEDDPEDPSAETPVPAVVLQTLDPSAVMVAAAAASAADVTPAAKRPRLDVNIDVAAASSEAASGFSHAHAVPDFVRFPTLDSPKVSVDTLSPDPPAWSGPAERRADGASFIDWPESPKLTISYPDPPSPVSPTFPISP